MQAVRGRGAPWVGRVRTAVLVAVLTLVAGAGCGPDGTGSEAEEPPVPTVLVGGTPVPIPTPGPTATPIPDDAVVIGSLLAESGVMARQEVALLAAARIAAESLEEDGLLGRPVVFLHTDTRSRQSVLYDETRRLVARGARMLIVGCEQEFIGAVIDALATVDEEVLLLSPCGADRVWHEGSVEGHAFSFAVPAAVEGRIMAERGFAAGSRRAALLVDSSSGGPPQVCGGFATRWRELGGSIGSESRLSFADAATLGFDPDGLRERVGAVDLVVLCADPTAGIPILQAIRNADLAMSVIAGTAMAGGWMLNEVAGLEPFEVVAYASLAGDDPSPAVVDLVDRYFTVVERFPESGHIVLGADVVEAYARAVTAAGSTDPAAVRRELERFDGEPLVSGPLSFAPDQHVAAGRTMRILRASGMQLVFVETRVAGQR